MYCNLIAVIPRQCLQIDRNRIFPGSNNIFSMHVAHIHQPAQEKQYPHSLKIPFYFLRTLTRALLYIRFPAVIFPCQNPDTLKGKTGPVAKLSIQFQKTLIFFQIPGFINEDLLIIQKYFCHRPSAMMSIRKTAFYFYYLSKRIFRK